jgi:polysaccharide pyruvyl transferase WcaK-like protein
MEVILAYLREKHPTATVDAMSSDPERMWSHYGIPATKLFHERTFTRRPPKLVRAAFLLIEKLADLAAIATWTRRHDVVIIPGMGVLEATLRVDPWSLPYSMYVLSVCGKLFRTKVALVSVGASSIKQASIRWLYVQSARLANYVSFRDAQSREVMAQQGLDTSRIPVYPDLAFAIPVPSYEPGEARTIGIGVMHYSGSNVERHRSQDIRAAYVQNVKLFARWLLDHDYRIRLFFGDDEDAAIAREVLADLVEYSPNMSPGAVALESVATFDDVTRVVQSVSMVVATRFHNLVAAVRLAKPTLSLGYGRKSIAIMADAGLADFCLPAGSLDVAQVIERFKELERQPPVLREKMQENTAEKARLLDGQFALLSVKLFESTTSGPMTASPDRANAERDNAEQPAIPGL